MLVHPYNLLASGRLRQKDQKFEAAWATQAIQSQPRLHSETLPQKKKNPKNQDKYA
jgi:hypothetical protein